ncbi:MAG: hypothetical protein IH914_06910 [candidate division Zixibacteria bacterium]|nr:hypothetical protein [candidate division Zixibacteria bacterium]
MICSTTTLALGVNLPAETVFVEPQKYCVGPINGPGGGPDRPGRRPRRSRGSVTGMLPLPASEFASIAGRAGRYRADALTSPGASDALVARAALLAETEFERDILWETYIEPHEVDPLVSAFAVGVSGGNQWASLALELVVSGLAGSLAELETLLANSLVWRAEPECVRAALEIAVARLIECGLVVTEQAQDRTAQERPGERLCASAAGRAGALSGLSIAGIERFISAANGPQPISERQWLASALSAPDLERAAGSRLPRGSHFAALRRLFADAPDAPDVSEGSGSLQEFIQPSRFGHGRAISASALNCRLAALAALELWRSGQEGRALESETQLSVAQIAELARVAGWLLGALADIRTALAPGFDADEQIQTQIQTLRRTLRAGLPAPVAALGERTGRLFNRAELMALNSLGCASAAEIAALPEKVVVEALESASLGGTKTAKQKLAALSALLSNKSGQGASPPPAHREEKHMPHTATLQTTQAVSLRPLPPHPIQPTVGLIPCRLRIDGASCGERFLVTIDGLPAPLTGKSFKYLAKLACARSTTPEGWLYKDEIEQGFNQARYLYRMRREIEAALPGYNWPVYENNRLGYYRLRLDPQALEIDIERIAASHDYEVAALAETLRLQRPPDLHCQTAP